ncbi:MAG: YibE/F family protein [Patescibacteria group bacterium]
MNRKALPKIILFALVALFVFLLPGLNAARAESDNVYYYAVVSEITDYGTQDNLEGITDGPLQEWQTLQLKILNGDKKGEFVTVNNGKNFIIGTFQKYDLGDKVVINKPADVPDGKDDLYYIVDQYRIPNLLFITLSFFALAIFFGRRRGLTAIIGMVFSVAVIFYFIIPRILGGADPFLTTVAGATVIILISLYLSHGFNKRTTISLISSLIALGIAVLIDLAFVHFAYLTGNGTEEAFYLQFGDLNINLKGVLLSGIIIGVLGVLDDVTTGQTAAVEEIHSANNSLGFNALFRSGLSVGQEHIAALVNTLVLAYAGASFPLLLLYGVQKTQPLWVTLNSSFIAEEIVRTLVGSAVLVIAVPLTTLLAAFYYSKQKTGRNNSRPE